MNARRYKVSERTARRKRLLGDSPPFVRMMKAEDLGWMWASWRAADKIVDITPEVMQSFADEMTEFLSAFDNVLMIEDRHPRFNSGSGPVGLVVENDDGWAIQPHFHWLSWAKSKHKVRGVVSYLTAAKNDRRVGVVVVNSDDANHPFYDQLGRYLAVNKAGCIRGGNPDGSVHTYYVRGRRPLEREDAIRNLTG